MFEQWWPTIALISTKWTAICHLKTLTTKRITTNADGTQCPGLGYTKCFGVIVGNGISIPLLIIRFPNNIAINK
jgi:hypothetical protein